MYTIKMGDSKELITTVRTHVYQGEKNADTLVFLVPNQYDDVDVTECTVTLRYVLPLADEYADIPLLVTAYNDDYLACTTSLAAPLTSVCGTVTMWLLVRDADNQLVMESGNIALQVDCRHADDPDEPAPDKDKLDKLVELVENLQNAKADSIAYDSENRQLQLTANGHGVGQTVTVPADDYAGGGGDGADWGKMDSD